MSSNLIDSTLLFDFSIKLLRVQDFVVSPSGSRRKTKKRDAPNAESYLASHSVPCFGVLSGKVPHSQVSVAWSTDGLYFQMRIQGKKQPPRFVQDRGGYSDGLRVWVDTRCSLGIHRATRFCHCFHFFPGQPKSSSSVSEPTKARGILDEIPRARELPAPIDPSDLHVQSTFHDDGYTLLAKVPANCLTGYSPMEFDRIRLFYDVVDAELGTQSMSLGQELKYAEDPSYWIQASLESSISSSRR